MGVTILLPEEFGRYCGGERLQATEGATVAEAVQDLARRFPDVKIRLLDSQAKLHPYFMAIHNGVAIGHDDISELQLADGDRLELLSMASGG